MFQSVEDAKHKVCPLRTAIHGADRYYYCLADDCTIWHPAPNPALGHCAVTAIAERIGKTADSSGPVGG